MLSIYKKEISAFFNSLMGYLVIILFLTGIGLFVWVFPDTVFDYRSADLNVLFGAAPYILMFLIPAITMRSIAEEKKTGTLELLLTRPVTEWQIILGKYFSSLTLVLLALLPTLVYYFTVYYLGNPPGNIDSAAVFGSYIGLLLLAAAFTAVGIFTSSVTDNQIVAFILSSFMCLILYEGLSYAALFDLGYFSYALSQLAFDKNYYAISRGVIDSRNVLYFLSVAVVMLSATKLVIHSRKW